MSCTFWIIFGLANAVFADNTFSLNNSRTYSSCEYPWKFSQVGETINLRSPNWPNNYPNNAFCKYTVTSPPGTVISMNCTEFHMELATGCAYDYFTFSLTGDSTFEDGTRSCGTGSFAKTTSTNCLVAKFKSDGDNPSSRELYRFQCVLTVLKKHSYTAAPLITTKATTKAPTTTTKATTTAVSTTAPTTKVPATFSNRTCTCGVRNNGLRIVGGVEALPNEFPWRVSLRTSRLGAFCGGTLISSNWVMTASHCLDLVKSGETLRAFVGGHDLREMKDTSVNSISCDFTVKHPKFNKATFDNDIGLCRLSKRVTISKTIQPICLPWSWLLAGQSLPGKTVTTSGWGTTSYGGAQSQVLKKVDLTIKLTEACRLFYLGTSQITDNMICTYGILKDTCQGDSGGSIDYKDPETGRYLGVGIVSWGIGCANIIKPGVYTKVSNYLDWISSITDEKFCR